MKCETHPAVDAVGICQTCGRGACADCKVLLGGIVRCKECVESGRAAASPAVATTIPPRSVAEPPQLNLGVKVALYLLSAVPFAGLALAMITFYTAGHQDRRVGQRCVLVGVASSILGCVAIYVLRAVRPF